MPSMNYAKELYEDTRPDKPMQPSGWFKGGAATNTKPPDWLHAGAYGTAQLHSDWIQSPRTAPSHGDYGAYGASSGLDTPTRKALTDRKERMRAERDSHMLNNGPWDRGLFKPVGVPHRGLTRNHATTTPSQRKRMRQPTKDEQLRAAHEETIRREHEIRERKKVPTDNPRVPEPPTFRTKETTGVCGSCVCRMMHGGWQ